MPVYEYAANMHMHTPYSDGEWYHARIAEAAIGAGLDLICVTDHNVWVKGPERYYEQDGRRVLLLVGEEVHDQTRDPQKNHLLVYGADKELAPLAPRPQKLLEAAARAGALTFLAHPVDPPAPAFHQPDLSWVTWDVTGFTGIELWNYMTAFKGLLTSKSAAIRYALNPELGVSGPFPETLAKWDELTAAGRRVVAIGNADAHGTTYSMFGLTRCLFPYDFLFRAVNTHIITEAPLSGDASADRQLLLAALARGRCFVGYDEPASTKGFRFTANFMGGSALMGDEVRSTSGVTLQIGAPARCYLRLLRDGQEAGRWDGHNHATYIVPARTAGVYRVEAYLDYKGARRGWIFSNPIYVRAGGG